jgi:DNA-binding PucR family transcriptional regulator
VFSAGVLGPLLDSNSASAATFPETLESFLARNGSWARTADALHLHVNTVHYGLDLWAALLCCAGREAHPLFRAET